ncbi:aldehyde reductase [Gammaproteobacteria bacterium]|nr:aldehyde reductase [Gammaproteobacteria bacterium]MDA9252170.1 aldehyde reductase [Gammaproteobacteria bacterium]MDB9984837.1 aldehyde reductase [Gammaproteobacteria bacterium]
MEKVLVTGATGFIGLHCIQQLLDQGYAVKGTLRSMQREPEVRQSLEKHNTSCENLTLYPVDLMSDEGWDEAMSGCDYLLHVASPFVLSNETEEFFVKPAVEGALRALKFADKHDIKKVVLTSSFAAVGDTFDGTTSFNETHWSDTSNNKMTFYSKSKTLAERAAWDYVKDNDVSYQLTVINPVGVLGPSLSDDVGISNSMVLRMLNGSMPALAKIHIGIVDVRDVAKAHILAMKNTDSDGERFIVSEKEMWMSDIANVLNANGYKAPEKNMPNLLLKVMALFKSDLKTISKMAGKQRDCNTTKAKDVLGWNPIAAEESILAAAKQIIDYDLI